LNAGVAQEVNNAGSVGRGGGSQEANPAGGSIMSQQSDLVWEDFSWRLGSPPPHTERQDSQGPSRLGLSFLFARLAASVTVKSRHAFVRFAHGAARRRLLTYVGHA
jgi:hypothetical protein